MWIFEESSNIFQYLFELPLIFPITPQNVDNFTGKISPFLLAANEVDAGSSCLNEQICRFSLPYVI